MIALSKRSYAIGAAVLVIGVALFLLFQTLTPKTPTGIEIAPVTREDVVEEVSETGAVASAQEVALAFERGGRIVEIPVAVGSTVKTGDILVQLDDAQQ